MRLEGNNLFISERNARALLAKLEGFPKHSFCTIATHDLEFFLTIEPDEIHYADREPGKMNSETESKMSEE